MDKELCKRVINNPGIFVPLIFTKKQYETLKKYVERKLLSGNEKTYLYTSITKKINALSFLKQEFYVQGKNMIPSRIKKAKKILSEINEPCFISGSFLYKEKYDDIDLFVLSKRKLKEKNNYHYVYITLKDLEKPMIASAASYYVSNFEIPLVKIKKKRYGFENTYLAYQMAVQEVFEKNGFKTLKDLILEHNLVTKNDVLDSYELNQKYEKIKRESDPVKNINFLMKEIMMNAYSKRYLYEEFVKLSKKFGEEIKKNRDNDNLVICKNLFDEIKNESRRAII